MPTKKQIKKINLAEAIINAAVLNTIPDVHATDKAEASDTKQTTFPYSSS